MFIAVQTIRNKQLRRNEICLITTHCLQLDITNQGKQKNTHVMNFSFLKKPSNSAFPFDLKETLIKRGSKRANVQLCLDERGMLDMFTRHVESYDPDFFAGHDLYTKHLDVIINRLSFIRETFWNRISRLRFRGMPARGDTGSI